MGREERQGGKRTRGGRGEEMRKKWRGKKKRRERGVGRGGARKKKRGSTRYPGMNRVETCAPPPPQPSPSSQRAARKEFAFLERKSDE